ncbi:DUF881 domain-containing protein [Tomitella fengzijianii]|uniref:DUF881 domain-containing protein n=1 Tax=Tomitella fengzijianii TaxID=2597660 RepID=A0A516X746_9ACTN|nr:DUF881 domain-containing protein [Tomitella fengzijianii]QDQ98892.1 DUF881 domain-containing protein [Tomitella fengzijianii]
MGLLIALTYVSSQGRELRTADSARLSDLVRQARSDTDSARAERDDLQAQLEAGQSRAAGSDAGVAGLLDQAQRLDEQAGLGALTGPGVTVTLTDAKRDAAGDYPAGARPDDLVVHQQDVQSVLNALWAGGADAIQVQDQRVTTQSAPLCIGNTLLLGGRTYSPPYVITAIGPVESMRGALDRERGVQIYKQYAERYGLGYDVTSSDSQHVAAAGNTPPLRYARPLGG